MKKHFKFLVDDHLQYLTGQLRPGAQCDTYPCSSDSRRLIAFAERWIGDLRMQAPFTKEECALLSAMVSKEGAQESMGAKPENAL